MYNKDKKRRRELNVDEKAYQNLWEIDLNKCDTPRTTASVV
jgi:hypothetical protein